MDETYDLAGRLATATDARGVLLSYSYNDADQLTSLLFPTGSIAYSYDAAGRQTQMTDPIDVTGWIYDDSGRVTSTASPGGAISYGYDDAGNRTSLTLPGSRTATYSYDAAGQLTSATDWLSRTTTYGYDLDGALTTVERPNGINSLYSYDDTGRLTTIEHGDATSLLQRYVYTLDANGNRTSVTTSGTAATPGAESYTFDALDRLTAVSYPGGGSASYAYDAAGNRTSVTSGTDVTDYTYDAAGQMTQIDGPIGTVAVTYDENGNRLAADGDSYAWTWDNQLASVDDGSQLVSFSYAGDGARVSRTDGAGTTNYLWDREAGLDQLVDDGTIGYLHGPDGLSEEIAGSSATSNLPDALGSVRGRADGSGAITGTADYDVWGNPRAASGTQSRLGWTGELRDPATGLIDLRARDYAPGIGQFLSRDTTIPNADGTQGFNRYAYANGNPVTFTDPSGHGIIDAFLLVIMILTWALWRFEQLMQNLKNGTDAGDPGDILTADGRINFTNPMFSAAAISGPLAGGGGGGFGVPSGAGIGAALGGAAVAIWAVGWIAVGAIEQVIGDALSPTVVDQINAIPEPTPEPAPTPEPSPTPGPIIKTPSADNSCEMAYQTYGITGFNEKHIEVRHGPGSDYNSSNPNGEFSQTAWNVHDQMAEYVLSHPSSPPTIQSRGRCRFEQVDVGMATGSNRTRTRYDVHGAAVIYSAFQAPYGFVISVFPYMNDPGTS